MSTFLSGLDIEDTLKVLKAEQFFRKFFSGTPKCTAVWKTKTGDQIPVCDMADSHLENTIAMLERHIETQDIIYENSGVFWLGEAYSLLSIQADGLLCVTVN